MNYLFPQAPKNTTDTTNSSMYPNYVNVPPTVTFQDPSATERPFFSEYSIPISDSSPTVQSPIQAQNQIPTIPVSAPPPVSEPVQVPVPVSEPVQVPVPVAALVSESVPSPPVVNNVSTQNVIQLLTDTRAKVEDYVKKCGDVNVSHQILLKEYKLQSDKWKDLCEKLVDIVQTHQTMINKSNELTKQLVKDDGKLIELIGAIKDKLKESPKSTEDIDKLVSNYNNILKSKEAEVKDLKSKENNMRGGGKRIKSIKKKTSKSVLKSYKKH